MSHYPNFNTIRLMSFGILLLCLAVCSCNNTPPPPAGIVADTLGKQQATADSALDDDFVDSEYDSLYAVVADTGTNYYLLDSKMYAISKALQWPVDTMERFYDANKQAIVLPDTIEDEMYRGEYYPRRDESRNLSIEYYTEYSRNSTQKNMAIIAGLYRNKYSADSLCSLLKKAGPNAFVYKAGVYAGCMH